MPKPGSLWQPDEVPLPNPACRGGTPACGDGPHRAASTHHLRPRALGGSNHVSNLVKMCVDGHRWIHRNPAEAIRRGLLTLPPHFDHNDNPLPDCSCIVCTDHWDWIPTKRGTSWWP